MECNYISPPPPPKKKEPEFAVELEIVVDNMVNVSNWNCTGLFSDRTVLNRSKECGNGMKSHVECKPVNSDKY
jgi:hypothetical protein